ncbi:hypothetical protein CPB84DRAFT_1851782 [Gymnopilus junonius]|uniref:C2H2-type domain-containing protein n=1 Tax=Gymnopilus junonius TaxID=109634 RepID=A0A9P5ND75_GYMJU|nr:hypothetical protein CPB84DRAFT_1851782 [Gymnopilus junonius]
MPLFLDESIPQCPACEQVFKTSQGLNAHLSMAKSFPPPPVSQSTPAPATDNPDPPSFNWEAADWPDFEDERYDFDTDPSEDIDRDEFILLPPDPPQAGPSRPQRQKEHPNMH